MFPADRGLGPGTAEDLRAASELIELISELDGRIAHLSFAEVTRAALAFMGERLGLGRASIALLESDGLGFRIFDSTVEVRGVESGKVVPFASGTLGAAVTRQRATYRPDIPGAGSPDTVDTALIAAGYRSAISVPLLVEGRCIGTLNGAARAVDGIGPFTRRAMELLAPRMAFAIHAGLAHGRLAESESRFRDVFANVNDGIVVADVTTRAIVMINARMCALLGRNESELRGETIAVLHPADRLEEVLFKFVALVEGHADSALDVPLLRADGSVFEADVAAQPTTLAGKACVVGVFRDASVRKRHEQEHVQMQKLESIRTLAAGIAHDFNNLLTGLIGYMSMVETHLAPGSEAAKLLDEAQRAAFQSTSLTRQLLTFAKGGTPVRAVVDLVEVARGAARLATSGSNVQCQFDLPAERVLVLGDEGQLAQVFHNLVRNAVEAMPGGGNVCLRLARRAAREIGAGQEACVEVADHGSGIEPALLERVFTPFFSTKHGGTGLGLAVAYSIVQGHGGRITAASHSGKGATFTVVLPVTEEVGPPGPGETAPAMGAGRLLLMDDQELVRQVAERALRAVGYVVRSVGNGPEAIAAYREASAAGQRFDAVILDLTIPGGMGGREVAAAILALDPEARIMVSSGYSDDATMSDYQSHGFRAVLPKPYNAYQLRLAVARLLPRPTV
jgi:PAS domain S-box-containing protein